MNISSARHVVDQVIQAAGHNIPEQVQQLAYQLDTKTQLIVHDFGYYGLLFASLSGVILVLFGSLMLLLDHSLSLRKSALSSPCQSSHKVTFRHSKHVTDTHIAKANRAELRFVSAQIRAGKFSN